ncbi:hypothetical protein [Pseudomonas cremoricolorata]|nr:hypothetical protein [Pseudomonas cremoricolorata]
MQTRNLVAEMFLSMPIQLWVLPVAGLIAYFGLRQADASPGGQRLWRSVSYGLLLALAFAPNALYAALPGTAPVESGALQPNYLGRFYLDAFYAFAGWAGAWVVRSRLNPK